MKSIKKFILFGVLFAFASTLAFSQNDRELNYKTDSIYKDLNFNKKGICEKEFIVKYESFGKALIFADRKEVKRVLGFIPTTSLAFSIDKKYYIPVVEDSNFFDLMHSLDDHESIKIRIRYYKNLKDDEKYFALILSVKRLGDKE
ncbi:MAG: hypothetical protein RBT05_04025 [Bacteroidales bacterium]|jgi:hypothetical protein|nr:hypothetical protein [Bacteroidales bacterium]